MKIQKQKINLDFLEDLTEEFDRKLKEALDNKNKNSQQFSKQNFFLSFITEDQNPRQQPGLCTNKLFQQNSQVFQEQLNNRNQQTQLQIRNFKDLDPFKESLSKNHNILEDRSEFFGFNIEKSYDKNFTNQQHSPSEEEFEYSQSDNCQNTNQNFIYYTPDRKGESQQTFKEQRYQ